MNDPRPGTEVRPGAAPPPARGERILVEDEIPASVGQLKSLRRWVIVAGVWAVAATALGVFALVEANKEDDASREQTAGELGRVQSQLNERIAALEEKVDGLPTSEDVQNLDTRLAKVEDANAATGDSIEELTGRLDTLEKDLNDLEQAVADAESATTDDLTETAP